MRPEEMKAWAAAIMILLLLVVGVMFVFRKKDPPFDDIEYWYPRPR